MTESEKKQKEQAEKMYKKLPPEAQMYFNTLMNLAVILFKSVYRDNEK